MPCWIISILALLAFTGAVRADDAVPAAIQDVGVDEKPVVQLPLDATFTDELGHSVALADCLIPGKPAILQLGYFGCPMLCDVISKGMLQSMKDLDLQIGRDFSVIFISFDPRETKTDAFQKKSSYVAQYDRPGAGRAWHFLVGGRESIKAIAQTTGFKYKWIEESKQFSHPAVLMVLSPQGQVSRYLYGVEFPQQTLRLSLVEASAGKIGTTADRILMFCYSYDEKVGKYTLAAMGLMHLGGALTVIILATVLIRLFVKERRATRLAQAGGS